MVGLWFGMTIIFSAFAVFAYKALTEDRPQDYEDDNV